MSMNIFEEKEFDKWFNHGTKKQPRFAYASKIYSEVKKFIGEMLDNRELAVINKLRMDCGCACHLYQGEKHCLKCLKKPGNDR